MRDEKDVELLVKIQKKYRGKAGWRTIKIRLKRKHDVIMNHKKIRRLMKEYDLQAKVRRKNPYKMMAKKTQEHRTCKNILKQNFKIEKPNRVYSTDITYLNYRNGQRAYLSVLKDIASGEIIAHKMSKDLRLDFVSETLAEGINRTPKDKVKGLIIHSDQGFHYTHPETQYNLKKAGIKQSMSRKGNCLDNAPIESFFGHLKDETEYKSCNRYEEVKAEIDRYVKYFNNERYQWNKKQMTPVEYRGHLMRSL